ncbi:two-component sensor histidine kinase [Winogradskyella psychrotolerans RS-3]|uniref:Two-component sensor histidine kinase n=1 Tax=Winogradskyella psychrotolerans RS-3 TaxID=641526 RepID=S7VQV3_9FLAO|nr:hypothetical protein [Winogradskyella psychrotolerans]EPR72381.1 two-component sensor histidine kinase [Winogradskyella psychrotolerans RS-3]
MKTKNTLFYKIAGVLTLLFVALAFLITKTSTQLSEDYHDEITQGLNKNVSGFIVEEIQGLYDGDSVVGSKMSSLMHHVMATNPATEVYLLDLEGNILKHVAMNKEVKAKRIDLKPVTEFIAQDGEVFIKGDDPKLPGTKKYFQQHLTFIKIKK